MTALLLFRPIAPGRHVCNPYEIRRSGRQWTVYRRGHAMVWRPTLREAKGLAEFDWQPGRRTGT